MIRRPTAIDGHPLTRRQLLAGGSLLAAGVLFPGQAIAQTATPPPVPDNPMDALVARIRAPQAGDDVVNALIEAFAACGIPTYEDTAATAPIIPVTGAMAPNRLLRWQAHNLAIEIRNRGGRDGAMWDVTIPVPEGNPPPSLILAGYVATATTPGGDLARAIMGEQDWTQIATIHFPAVIGALLVADIARERSPLTVRQLAVPLGARQGVCSSLQGWVEQTIAAIFDALKLEEPDDTVGQVITGIWNWIVDVGETVVGGLVTELTEGMLSIVRAVAGLVGTASQIVSLLQPWTISIEPMPEVIPFAIDDATVSGIVHAHVTTGLVTEWPADIADCAAVAGLALPDLTAGAAPITWQFTESPIDLVAITTEPSALDDAGDATLTYDTNHESAEDAKGTPHEGLFAMCATVERDDLRTLGDTVLVTVLSGLPAIVRDIVVPILGPVANDIVASLVGMVSVMGYGLVTVIYHTRQETPEPSEEVLEQGACPAGTWRIVDFISMLNSFMATTGATVTYTEQSGDSLMTFGPGDAFTWSAAAFAITGGDTLAGIGAVEATVTLDGTLTGRYAVEGNALTILETTGGGMTGVAAAYLNGSPLGETPLDPAGLVYMPGAGYTYACDGNTLLLYPTWIAASAPMVLERV